MLLVLLPMLARKCKLMAEHELTLEYLFDPDYNEFRSLVTLQVNKDGLIENISSKKEARVINGYYVAGIINMHTHLEFSWMKGQISPYKKFPFFIQKMREAHALNLPPALKEKHAKNVLNKWIREGVSHVVDISNSYLAVKAFYAQYITVLIELFGSKKSLAQQQIEQAMELYLAYSQHFTTVYFTPHTLFTLSEPLWDFLLPKLTKQLFYSIHFMESNYEVDLLKDPVQIAIERLPKHVRVFFVHNTYLDEKSLNKLFSHFTDPWFVLCPRSNYYIEKRIPPVDLLKHHCEDRILIGTDSMASNWSLDVWKEVFFLQKHFPHIPLSFWLKSITVNSARALFKDEMLGNIQQNKKAIFSRIPDRLLAN